MSNYAEAMGFTHFWGYSPQINLVTKDSGEFNILLSGTSDLRHILETCRFNCKNSNLKINFYIHEKAKEPVCRSLLLLLLIHTSNFTYKERTDMFLEIFGNSYLREQTAGYIDKMIPFLDDLISKETKHKSALNQMVDLKELKFKDRDDMVDVIRSWYSFQEFKMDQLRDTRLRHHYGVRYDFRVNLIDWDYQMNLKEYAPIVHFYHYREWRQSGIAFESRFSSYPTANRTLASYLPGRDKKTKDSLLVRGFWGDVVISPYFALGVKCDVEPEKTELFRVRNMQQVSHAVTISEFNLQHIIQKLDNLSDYHMNLEELTGKKPEDQLEKIDEQTEYLQQQEVVEVITKDQMVVQIQQDPLQVFRNLSIKIIPIFEEYDKLYNKKKFQNFFDVGVLGFMESLHLKEQQLKGLFKQDCELYVESAKYIVPFKKEEREKASENIKNMGLNGGWKLGDLQQNEYITFNLK